MRFVEWSWRQTFPGVNGAQWGGSLGARLEQQEISSGERTGDRARLELAGILPQNLVRLEDQLVVLGEES